MIQIVLFSVGNFLSWVCALHWSSHMRSIQRLLSPFCNLDVASQNLWTLLRWSSVLHLSAAWSISNNLTGCTLWLHLLLGHAKIHLAEKNETHLHMASKMASSKRHIYIHRIFRGHAQKISMNEIFKLILNFRKKNAKVKFPRKIR